MWIICAGSQRSGSTLQYNIAARIVELKGLGKRLKFVSPEEFNEHDYKNEAIDSALVFKTHFRTNQIDNVLNMPDTKIIFSYRDIRDVAVSMKNKGWIDDSLKALRQLTFEYLRVFEDWMIYKERMYVSKYEDFYHNISSEVIGISNYLKVELTQKEIETIVNELSEGQIQNESSGEIETKGKFRFDKKTLLHEGHIQGKVANQFKTGLSELEILEIEKVSYNWINNYGYELFWPTGNYFLSHSQHGEDYIAWSILNQKRYGVVVEVGAFDGVHLSNSLSLENIGWKSICIEPNPVMFPYLKKQRPKAVNYNYAIVADSGIDSIPFYVEQIGVLSGLSVDEDDLKKRYIARGLKYETPEKVQVKAIKLSEVFKEQKLGMSSIDVVSIDVEGHELEVLGGIDFDKCRPSLFIVEANSNEFKTQILLFFKNLELGYELVLENKQNLFIGLNLGKETLQNLKKTNFDQVVFAEQYHPVNPELAIQSVKPQLMTNYNESLCKEGKGRILMRRILSKVRKG
jgi:FkbM family methyltransferase